MRFGAAVCAWWRIDEMYRIRCGSSAVAPLHDSGCLNKGRNPTSQIAKASDHSIALRT